MKYIYDSSSQNIRIGVADDMGQTVVWIEISYTMETAIVTTSLTGGLPDWKTVSIERTRAGRGWQLYHNREKFFCVLRQKYPRFFSK